MIPRRAILVLLLALLAMPGARARSEPPPSAEYTVGPADVLEIGVFDEDEMSGGYTVSSGGQIVFPLLGSVPVAGLTAKQIEQQLTELLEEDYLYDAMVSVRVTSYRSRTVKVLGSVVKPGVYYLDGPTTLLDVLSQAGGIASSTGEVTRGQTARVVRPSRRAADPETGEGPAPTTMLVDLYELLVEGVERANLLLEQGDTVYVPESVLVHVVGEVKKPGSFPFEEGMTVLKAITLAGGATTKGAPKSSIVKRIRSGKEVQIKVALEDRLEPDDIVEVPRSFW